MFAPDDFTLSGTVYRAEKTQTIAIVDDDLFEPPVDGNEESFTVLLERTPAMRARLAIPDTTDAPGAMVVTIEDDDKPDWTLTVEPDTIAEAGTEYSTVTVLTGGKTFATDQTITLLLAGTATETDDFTVTAAGTTLTAPYEITLAADETSVTATITAVDDAVDDDTETILVAAMLDDEPIGDQQTITITDDDEPVSTDATLSGLAVNDGTNDLTLTPTFATDTTSYAASVANDIDQITVAPETTDDSASVEYLDASDAAITDADDMTEDQQVDLLVGANTIKVKVTAEDAMTTETYTVVVTRAAAVAATITDVAITSDPDATGPDDDTYAIGDTVKVTVTFSDTVTVDTTNGSPTLELDFEGDPKSAAYDMDASNGAAVVFAYTVVKENDITSNDGIAIKENQLALNTGTIRTGGADADLDYEAVDADPTHLVHGVRPEFKSAAVDRTVDASALVLTFSEALDTVSTPAIAAFTVTNNTVTDVAISGAEVTLTLGTAMAEDAMNVTLTYVPPPTTPLRNAVGNAAAGITDSTVSVWNELTAEFDSHSGFARRNNGRFSEAIGTTDAFDITGGTIETPATPGRRGDDRDLELDTPGER